MKVSVVCALVCDSEDLLRRLVIVAAPSWPIQAVARRLEGLMSSELWSKLLKGVLMGDYTGDYATGQ